MVVDLARRHLPLRSSSADILSALLAARDDSHDIHRRLRSELESYEVRFGIPSSEVAARLSDGSLEETADVCSWLISIQSLNALGDSADRR